MAAYFNEFEPTTAQWLRVLIANGLIAEGHVDDRSIVDVHADDLDGYTQAHFFAGVGVWSHALRLAGWPDGRPVWTGSPPCQPFSLAGRQLGKDDPRHLAPTWLRLIREHRPPVIFGEQVADAIKKGWLDDLFNELEAEGYACAAAVLPACSVGSPHIRKRLFFGAHRLAQSESDRDGQTQRRVNGEADGVEAAGGQDIAFSGRSGGTGGDVLLGLGDANGGGWERRTGPTERGQPHGSASERGEGFDGEFGAGEIDLIGLVNADSERPQGVGSDRHPQGQQRPDIRPARLRDGTGIVEPAYPTDGFWRSADWLGCRDGKFRPVRPGTFPLVDGAAARVVRLRAYGNAIVPQVAAAFIEEFCAAAGIDLRPIDLDDLI